MGDGLLGAADLRRIAATAGVRPSKRMGQNFLHDANTIRRIVRLAQVRAGDVVLEIGPGIGSLTLGLLAAGATVTAVEIDQRLADVLPSTVRGRQPDLAAALTVVTADAVSLPELPGPAPDLVVANLPYNVAVPVLLGVLERLPTLRGGLVLVQAEVADRLAAPPGSRTYGVPSAKVAWWASVRRAGAVPRAVFWPVPGVDSGLVSLTRRAPPAEASRAATFAVIDAAFAQRRKTLRAALTGWAGGAHRAEQILRRAGIDPRARGESLDVATFARLAAAADDVPAAQS